MESQSGEQTQAGVSEQDGSSSQRDCSKREKYQLGVLKGGRNFSVT